MTKDLIKVLAKWGLELKYEDMVYTTKWPKDEGGRCLTSDIELVMNETTSMWLRGRDGIECLGSGLSYDDTPMEVVHYR